LGIGEIWAGGENDFGEMSRNGDGGGVTYDLVGLARMFSRRNQVHGIWMKKWYRFYDTMPELTTRYFPSGCSAGIYSGTLRSFSSINTPLSLTYVNT
jgi:hypothetical protein